MACARAVKAHKLCRHPTLILSRQLRLEWPGCLSISTVPCLVRCLLSSRANQLCSVGSRAEKPTQRAVKSCSKTRCEQCCLGTAKFPLLVTQTGRTRRSPSSLSSISVVRLAHWQGSG